ncbi:hypothetical protein FB45DRAFT_1094607 [Roridomyces roridus]|uniref:F-box domain-containing protein n=1 Tax=Roridomyces roridus TaxID=1738132 RepID=A0AAD7BGS9_9AGAR|nr:hypothetical protein FB45DRAFT_1094607 [Roridomyces roridus]
MSAAATDPLLPPDLERVIFELAAYLTPLSMPNLMLVAWRVKEWIEPLLYRVAVAGTENGWVDQSTRHYPQASISRLLSTSVSPIHHFVRRLCLVKPTSADTFSLLSKCPNIENIWASSVALELKQLLKIQPGRLKHLHCSLRILFHPDLPDFTHTVFAGITHLQIFDRLGRFDRAVWTGLASLPRLTHLAFLNDEFITIIPDLLRACPALRVLAVVAMSKHVERVAPEVLREDVRFVWIMCAEYMKDWHTGASTGRDFWTRAEEFISMRRTGEVDPLQYRMEDDESVRLP